MSARAWDRRRRKDRTVYLVWSGGWRDEDTVMAAFDREADAVAWLAASKYSRLGRVEACPLNLRSEAEFLDWFKQRIGQCGA